MVFPYVITVVILIVVILGVVMANYNRKIELEKALLDTSMLSSEVITEADLNHLPLAMRNYLLKVGVVGKPRYCNVQFRQNGSIKTDEKKNWLTFKATQYMSQRGFIWSARSFPMLVRDKYINGRGEVRVNLLGMKNLTVQSAQETSQSSLGRYFGELLWFPMGFLDDDIEWEEIDAKNVKGTITKNGISFDGYFHFTNEGFIDTFRGKRYRDTTLDDFLGRASHYVKFEGLLIPKTMTAIWELPQEDLEYFKADIYNYAIE